MWPVVGFLFLILVEIAITNWLRSQFGRPLTEERSNSKESDRTNSEVTYNNVTPNNDPANTKTVEENMNPSPIPSGDAARLTTSNIPHDAHFRVGPGSSLNSKTQPSPISCEYADLVLQKVATQWCDNLNREFSAMEEKSKILNHCFASNLTLGESPPELKTIRILPSHPERRDLDLLAKFVYLGGFSMEIHTQLQLYAVLEAHLKVTLSECSGNLLIRFSNYEDSPHDQLQFSVALLEEPYLNLEIKSVVGTFSDMSMIRQIIVGTLKKILRDRLVDPNSRTFRYSPKTGFVLLPGLALKASEKKAIMAEKRRLSSAAQSSIGRLFVQVTSFNYIISKENAETFNFYCIVSFCRQTKKTKVSHRTTNPQWEETFSFDIFDLKEKIVFSIYNRDSFSRDEFIGHCMFSLPQLTTDTTANFEQQLLMRGKKDDTATVQFSLTLEKFDPKVLGERTITYHKQFGLSQFDDSLIEKISLEPATGGDFDMKAFSPQETNAQFTKTTFRKIPSDINEVHVNTSRSSVKTSGLPLEDGELYGKIGLLVSVYVIQARGLVAHDPSGFCDPYCLVVVHKKSKKTKIQKRTLSPIWNERLSFPCHMAPNEITVQVYDWNRFTQHVSLGEAAISIPALNIQGGLSQFGGSYPLLTASGIVCGEIELIVDVELCEAPSAKAADHGDLEASNKSLPFGSMPASFEQRSTEKSGCGGTVEGMQPGLPGEPLVRTPQVSTTDGESSHQTLQQGTDIGVELHHESPQGTTRALMLDRANTSKEIAKQVASNLSHKITGYFSKQ